MDQLIRQITQRAGISEQQAREAVNATISFVKPRLPAPVSAQLDSLLTGQEGQQGGQDIAQQAQQAAGRAGGLFGQREGQREGPREGQR